MNQVVIEEGMARAWIAGLGDQETADPREIWVRTLFGGETIAENVADILVRADTEGGLFTWPTGMETANLNVYTVDLDALVLTLRPRTACYAQVGTMTVDVRDLWDRSGGPPAGPEGVFEVLAGAARELTMLVPGYRALASAGWPERTLSGGCGRLAPP